jgi:hypothetical protein
MDIEAKIRRKETKRIIVSSDALRARFAGILVAQTPRRSRFRNVPTISLVWPKRMR